MKSKSIVAHAVKFEQHYLGHAQAVPIINTGGDPSVDNLELVRYCADLLFEGTTPRKITWSSDGLEVSEDDLQRGAAMTSQGISLTPTLDRIRLRTPSGSYHIRPDLPHHVLGVVREIQTPAGMEYQYHLRKTTEMWEFLRYRHALCQSPVIPVMAVEAEKGEPAVLRVNPNTGQEVRLKIIEYPIGYSSIDDIYSLVCESPLEEGDIELLRLRASYHLYQLREGRTMFITWSTPANQLDRWVKQTHLLDKEEFYSDEGVGAQLPACCELDFTVDELRSQDLRILDIIEPDIAVPPM